MEVLPLYQSLEIRSKCKGVGVEWGSCKKVIKTEGPSRELECLTELYELKEDMTQTEV